jgi:hemerythrin-like domain-containing protein
VAFPTEDLKNEHEVIVKMLGVMERGYGMMREGKDVDPELWKGASEFLENFVDRCHHTKEEKHLFPTMMERGVSGEVGPIAVMMREHDDGRAHAKKLRSLIKSSPTKKKNEGISKAVRAYVDLLSMHIRKENGVLFPLADLVLTPADQKELEASFEEVEENVMGPGVHEKYHRMIEDWSAKYG